MMDHGTLAVAIVKRQVMVVQATRSHTRRDRYLDVHTYSPFGERVFLASEVPSARIASTDILTYSHRPMSLVSQRRACWSSPSRRFLSILNSARVTNGNMRAYGAHGWPLVDWSPGPVLSMDIGQPQVHYQFCTTLFCTLALPHPHL
ncbi:hypothetical protein BD779DRAFT_341451 [Infundibulicybe gibba]|nr:hypothetical protein BD779DRAFT_341451 [Infundibulicybe gibba]